MAAGAAPAQPGEAGARRDIARLLDRRAEAVVERDREAFRATLGGSGDFVARQLQQFEWMSRIDFASYELEADWTRLGDLVRPADRNRYPGAEAVTLPVTIERYRIAGYDRTDAVEDLFWTFVRRDGRWTVVSDSDVSDLGFQTARHIWDYGSVSAFAEDGFLALMRCAGASCMRSAERIVTFARRAAARGSPYWLGPPLERAVVMVPGSATELKRILQATFDVNDFVAFALSFIDGRDGVWFSGPRIAFAPTALAGADAERITHVLSHELLHVMTRTSSGPFLPLWLEEGFAEYAGRDADPVAVVAADAYGAHLPEDHEFTSGEEIFPSYQRGLSAVAFIVKRFGLRTLNDLYIDLGGRRVTAGTAGFHLRDAFDEHLGMTPRAFERRWASSIR